MLTWKQFNEIPNGTCVLNHGFDQCVALANLYHESVIGGTFVAVPSAYMWWTNYGDWETLKANYRTSQTPVAGAIFISRYGLYDAPNGHIGVVTKTHPDGTFDTMEQNAGTWRYVGRYRRTMQNMLGFLVPRKNPTDPPKAVTETPLWKEDDELFLVYLKDFKGTGKPRWAITGPNYWRELISQNSANHFAKRFGPAFKCSSQKAWDDFRIAAKGK